MIRLDLEYEGTDFRGFAPQPGLRTVGGELTRALNQVLSDEIRIIPAARTDAGVHARGQVVSFSTATHLPSVELRHALNAVTGPDLWIRTADDAESGFDARRDARSRQYEYCVWNAADANIWHRRWAAHVPDPLDLDAMQRACQSLEGQHDFGAFYTHQTQDEPGKRTVRRVLSIEWQRDSLVPELLRFQIEADGFLRHMVRAIVGSALLVGLGKRPADGVRRMLDSRDRALAGPTAPAAGLTLMGISY